MARSFDTDKSNKVREIITGIYGIMPERPLHLTYENEYSDPSFAAGKATKSGTRLMLDFGDKESILRVTSVIPNRNGSHPAIINFTTEEHLPNKYLPAEELIDRGYAIFSLCVNDVSCNNQDFKSGISNHIARTRRKKDSAGKLTVWAWAILRAVEYVCDLECIDKNAITVAGHGIYARAAMLAAGFDRRVRFVIANGIATSPLPYSSKNIKSGITVHDFPYLYSPSFAESPFGDEYSALLSHCYPRIILIGAAVDGIGLNYEDEFNYLKEITEKCYLPAELDGIGKVKIIPTAPTQVYGGEISYHVRLGTDYFSREDWNIYLDFIDRIIAK